MLDREPERLDRLSRERAAAAVDDRDRDPERQLGRDLLRGEDRGLGVEGVEDRLDQEHVDAAVAQPADLLRVGLAHVVEGDRAKGGVVDLRREREGHVERADRAGDEAVRPESRGLPGEPRALDVHVVDGLLEAVIGLADRGGREGVRRRDVGARVEVRAMGLGDDLRPRQVEQVGIALDLAVVVTEPLAAEVLLAEAASLEQHAPGAVEHDDALVEQRPQSRLGLRHQRLPCRPERSGAAAPTGSLGVFSPGRQAAFKALQVRRAYQAGRFSRRGRRP